MRNPEIEINVPAELGCEACAVSFLNLPAATDGYRVGCTKHAGAMSIDPIVAAVLAAEKRRDIMQHAYYVLDTLGELPNSGFTRAWTAEYASRDQSAAMSRAIVELDAAGIIDLDASETSRPRSRPGPGELPEVRRVDQPDRLRRPGAPAPADAAGAGRGPLPGPGLRPRRDRGDGVRRRPLVAGLSPGALGCSPSPSRPSGAVLDGLA